MNCPKCQIPMREREQDGLIIDICPQCRGVWLDAGELEKLSVRERGYYGDRDDDDDDDRRSGERVSGDREGYSRDDRARPADREYRSQRPKRKGFLSSIFESIEGGGD